MSRPTVAAIETEFRRYRTVGEGALDQLAPDELVSTPEAGNSIATLVWHVSGNLESRFTDFLTTDGEKPWRDRDSELVPRVARAEEVRAKWDRGWEILFRALEPLDDVRPRADRIDPRCATSGRRGACPRTRPHLVSRRSDRVRGPRVQGERVALPEHPSGRLRGLQCRTDDGETGHALGPGHG